MLWPALVVLGVDAVVAVVDGDTDGGELSAKLVGLSAQAELALRSLRLAATPCTMPGSWYAECGVLEGLADGEVGSPLAPASKDASFLHERAALAEPGNPLPPGTESKDVSSLVKHVSLAFGPPSGVIGRLPAKAKLTGDFDLSRCESSEPVWPFEALTSFSVSRNRSRGSAGFNFTNLRDMSLAFPWV